LKVSLLLMLKQLMRASLWRVVMQLLWHPIALASVFKPVAHLHDMNYLFNHVIIHMIFTLRSLRANYHTWVKVSPLFLASVRLSSGVG
jgi:hypothetical protein